MTHLLESSWQAPMLNFDASTMYAYMCLVVYYAVYLANYVTVHACIWKNYHPHTRNIK